MDTVWNFRLEDSWTHENGYYLTSSPSRLAKAIAHWELYKRISSLPGELVECGVFRGASLIRFATFREMAESQSSRRIIGFDAFGSFPKSETEDDREFIERFEGQIGTGIPLEELHACFAAKGFANYELIKGEVAITVPEYVASHPELKIALLHIDVDVYPPTRVILDHLFDRIVPGGIMVLDDYGTVAGETRAVDEFMAERGINLPLQKLPYYKIPVYLVKQ